MDNKTKIKTRLLDDEPTSSDHFNAHDKVATSIAEMIKNEEGGKSISLIGHWGSGKSSIIEILKNKLKDNCLVFTFNAWAHEGDPLRRAFLESLIDFLSNNNLIKKDDWKEKLKELSGNKENSEIINRKNPTNYGLILIFFTTLLPIALVILSLWPKISYFLLFISVGISIGPVIVFLIFLYKYFYTKDEKKKKGILSLLVNDVEKTTTSTSYKTIDPTSLEFQKEFHNLMTEAFNKEDDNKLLIVIDNLDRVADDDALKIWATMRTFFDFDNKTNISWLKKTWLLVPYDYSGLKKLWKDNPELSETKNQLVTSFTEKTFQISFNTPLLILSDSKKYFEDQFKYAFIEHNDDNEIHKVYRIFKELREPNNLPPTPREIKLFINQIVSLYLQWKEEIPIHILALFILLRKHKWVDDSHLISDILDGTTDFLIPSLKDLVHMEYREYLAALYFNTQKNNALQLLLKDKLEKALINKDEEFIKGNESLSGFTHVCEDIIQNNYDNWSKQEPNTLAVVCNSLSLISIQDDNINRAWNLIYRGFKQIDSWKSIQINSAEGICKILKRTNDTSFSNKILSSLSKSKLYEAQKDPEEKILVSQSKEQLERTIESLSKILSCIVDLSQTSIIKESFVVNTSANIYLDIILILVSKNYSQELISFFIPNCDINKIDVELSERITKGVFVDNNYLNLLNSLYSIHLDINWKELIGNLDKRLQNLNMDTKEVFNLLNTIMFLKKAEQESETTLKNLTLKGFIPHHLNIANKQKDFSLQSLTLFLILEYAYQGNLQQQVGESSQGINYYKKILSSPANNKDVLNELLNLFIHYKCVDKIFNFYNEKSELEKLSKYLIEQLFSSNELNKNITPDKFLEEEACFYMCLKIEEYYKVINDYVVNTDLITKTINQKFEKERASLYIGIIKNEKGRTSETIYFIREGLYSLSQNDWEDEYKDDRVNCFDLIIELNSYQIKTELKSAYLDQLKTFIESIINGEEVSSKIISNWNTFVLALDEDNQKTFLKFLINKINMQNSNLSKVLNIFNKNIIKCEVFIDDANDLVTQGFEKIVSRKNTEELNWLKSLIEYCYEIIDNCDKSYLNSLKDKIKGIIKEKDINDETKKTIKEIGGLLGIKKFAENPEESETKNNEDA